MKRLRLNTASDESLYVIDGSNQFYRFLYSPFRNLGVRCADCEGTGNQTGEHPHEVWMCPVCEGTGEEPTKAVYLFSKMLLKLIQDKKPTYLAVAFDGNRDKLKRRRIYPGYKANRAGTGPPPGAAPQMRRIKQICKALGIVTLQSVEHEADDIAATLATRYAAPNREAIVISRDKDMGQLCSNPNIFCSDPMSGEWRALATAGKRYGVETKQLVDYFILTGDAGDNVRGVGGFGPKTAAKLLQRHGTLDRIFLAATMGLLPTQLARSICAAKATGWLDLSRKLITLETNVELPGGIEELRTPVIDLRRVAPIFRALEFRTLLEAK